MTLPAFMLDARRHCKGSTLMWPEDGRGVDVAKAVCQPPGGPACPFVAECFQWAIDHGELWGVWGATSQRERNRMIRVRRGAKPSGPIPIPGCKDASYNLRTSYETESDAWASSTSHWPYRCDACGKWHLSRKKKEAA